MLSPKLSRKLAPKRRPGADRGRSGAPMAHTVPYNYEHFTASQVLGELPIMLGVRGPRPGELAPDFDLPDVDARRWRLHALRGRPVVLIFGNGT